MPVAANIRLAPPAADPTATPQAEGAAPVEMFGDIISGFAEASVETMLDPSMPAVADGAGAETAAPIKDSEVSVTVEQLLALATLPASSPMPSSKDTAETPKVGADQVPGDAPVIQASAAAAPAINLPPQGQPLPQAAASPDRPATAIEDVQVRLVPAAGLDRPATERAQAPSIPIAQQPSGESTQNAHAPQNPSQPAVGAAPAAAGRSPAGDLGRVVAGKAAPAGPDVQPAQSLAPKASEIASPRTESVVQLALSSLEAAVKASPAQAWHAPLAQTGPRGRRSEAEPATALPELKLTTAMTLPAINAAVAAFEPSRPADSMEVGAQPSPQPLDASELMVEHQLDMAHEGEWLDQLARDIAKSAGTDNSPLRFRLNPENLGSLRVEISQDRGGAAVRLTADTEAARAIIADAQPRLIAEARAQGIRISEAHVDLGGQTASGDPRRQNAAFEEPQLRTARSLQESGDGDGKPTPGRSERYA